MSLRNTKKINEVKEGFDGKEKMKRNEIKQKKNEETKLKKD